MHLTSVLRGLKEHLKDRGNMAIGFRKSLFGFNCDEVLEYVQKTHKAFTEKEIVYHIPRAM